jgi:hypothetical protein
MVTNRALIGERLDFNNFMTPLKDGQLIPASIVSRPLVPSWDLLGIGPPGAPDPRAKIAVWPA